MKTELIKEERRAIRIGQDQKEATVNVITAISRFDIVFNNGDDKEKTSTEADDFVRMIMLEPIYTGSTVSAKEISKERFINIWENNQYLRFAIMSMIDTVQHSEEVGVMDDSDFPPITIGRLYDAKTNKYHDTTFGFVLKNIGDDGEKIMYKWFAEFKVYEPFEMESENFSSNFMYMIDDSEDVKDLYKAFYRLVDTYPIHLEAIFNNHEK